MASTEEVMDLFNTGATRDVSLDKLDFEGFISPAVLERYAQYMHKNRSLPNGGYRDSDNWQLGIPKNNYMKSWWRHFFDVWGWHRGLKRDEDLETALCGALFNNMGYLHEVLKEKNK